MTRTLKEKIAAALIDGVRVTKFETFKGRSPNCGNKMGWHWLMNVRYPNGKTLEIDSGSFSCFDKKCYAEDSAAWKLGELVRWARINGELGAH